MLVPTLSTLPRLRSLGLVATTLAFLFIQPGIAQEPEKPADQVKTSTKARSAPARNTAALQIVLELRDAASASPIVDAVATIRTVRIDENHRLQFGNDEWKSKSDSRGIVTFELSDLEKSKTELDFELRVAGRAPSFESASVQRASSGESSKVIRLWPSVELKTQVFGADGPPAADGRVTVLADLPGDDLAPWQMLFRCDAEGRLQLQIPRSCPFGLIVVSERGAPHRVVFPAGTRLLEPIHLSHGSVVTGTLLDREGKPIADRQIVIESEDSQAVSTELEVMRRGGASLDLSFTRSTNADGRFRFPPMIGPVRVYGATSDELPTSSLIPVVTELTGSGETWLPLMLSPTGKVTGTVRWLDGRAASGVSLSLQVPPQRSNSYTSLGSVRTDSEGDYEIDVPFPIEDIAINAGGASGPDGNYWTARVAGAAADDPQADWKRISRYAGEPLTVDWTMAPRSKRPASADAPPAEVAESLKSLAELEQAIRAARDARKNSERADEVDPHVAILDRCLEFEAQHRGTRLAVGALHYIMRAAAMSLGRPEFDARAKAVKVIREHYLAHPDVDLLIGELYAGSGTKDAEPLLQSLADESPHAYVRAKALLELARGEMRLVQILEQGGRFAEPFKDHSPNDVKRTAYDLLDRITAHYTGVAAPHRTWRSVTGVDKSPELQLVERSERPTWKVRTVAEQAEILRFQMTRLQPDSAAPEIEGLDLHQQRIRLSQFRGRVVLLTITHGNSEEDLYAACSQVMELLKDQPFTCVSVIPGSGSGGYSIRAIVEDGKITWPIIRDTVEDDIAHRWCQQTWPAVYLIDQQGILRHHQEGDLDPLSIEKKVRDLIQGSK